MGEYPITKHAITARCGEGAAGFAAKDFSAQN
jgi:hypothetical protein